MSPDHEEEMGVRKQHSKISPEELQGAVHLRFIGQSSLVFAGQRKRDNGLKKKAKETVITRYT